MSLESAERRRRRPQALEGIPVRDRRAV